jgi:hypothetical protein
MTTVDSSANCSDIVLFLGNARDGEYEWFYENGIKIGIILDINNAKNVGDLNKFEFVERFDFKNDIGQLFTIMESIRSNYNITCLLHMREFYVRHSAILSEKYNFKGLSLEAAENCLSKLRMRALFQQNIGSHATVKYSSVESLADVKKFIEKVGLPLIIKPSNLYGSFFVDVINEMSQIETTYLRIKNGILNYNERSHTGTKSIMMQAEEYMDGSKHSIECLVNESGTVYITPIVDGFTSKDLAGTDDFHRFAAVTPSHLGDTEQQQVNQLAIDAVRALGMKSALAHVEMIYTDSGPKLLEVGAKPGGMRAQILNKAYGINLISAYAKMLKSQNFINELNKKWSKSFAFVRPLPAKKGTFEKFNDLDRIPSLNTYYSHSISVRPGNIVGPAKEGYMHFLTIELYADNLQDILSDIDYIAKQNNLFIVNYDEAN